MYSYYLDNFKKGNSLSVKKYQLRPPLLYRLSYATRIK